MANNDRFLDEKGIGPEELSLYDALVKHWALGDEEYAIPEQIDELFPLKPNINLVSWSTGTDEEISAMIDGYYNDYLSLADIQTVWHIGDIREVNISSIVTGGYVDETHAQQNIELVILDFEHDDLANNIENKTKSLITVQTKDCLRSNSNTLELGCIDLNDENINWENCGRRSWCNNNFYNSLPSYLKDNIKLVAKETIYNNIKTTISDKIFLISLAEYKLSSSSDNYIEGSLYKYYETESNRAKNYGWNSNYFSFKNAWWLRTLNISQSGTFKFSYQFNDNNGYIDEDSRLPSADCGIAPAFCL